MLETGSKVSEKKLLYLVVCHVVWALCWDPMEGQRGDAPSPMGDRVAGIEKAVIMVVKAWFGDLIAWLLGSGSWKPR